MMSTFLSIFFEPAKQHWSGGMGEKGSHSPMLLSEIVWTSYAKYVVSFYVMWISTLLQSHVRAPPVQRWRCTILNKIITVATAVKLHGNRCSLNHVDLNLQFDLFKLPNGKNRSCEKRLRVVQRCYNRANRTDMSTVNLSLDGSPSKDVACEAIVCSNSETLTLQNNIGQGVWGKKEATVQCLCLRLLILCVSFPPHLPFDDITFAPPTWWHHVRRAIDLLGFSLTN